MLTKLTLTIDQQVIESAKLYAHNQGRSLSNFAEVYLKYLTDQDKDIQDYSPRLRSLMGVVSLPENVDYKDLLQESLTEKYGK